jgi:hypothetical protein
VPTVKRLNKPISFMGIDLSASLARGLLAAEAVGKGSLSQESFFVRKTKLLQVASLARGEGAEDDY